MSPLNQTLAPVLLALKGVLAVGTLVWNIAYAEEILPASAARQPGDLSNVYKACEKVRVVSKDTYRKDRKRWDLEVAHCAQIQLGLDVGFTRGTISDVSDRIQAMDLMNLIAERHKTNLAANIAYIRGVETCFDRKSKSYASGECASTRQEVRNKTEALGVQARMELALSKGRDTDYGHAFADANKQDSNINAYAEPFSFWATAAMTGQPLSKREIETATLIRAQERAKMDAELQLKLSTRPKADTRSDSDYKRDFYDARLRRAVGEHRAKYQMLTQYEMPVLNYLKPTRWDQNTGLPQWSDDEIGDSIRAVLANAEKQKGITERAIARQKLEFGRYFKDGEIVFERFRKSIIEDERDLLDYIAFTPLVEEVLKEKPGYCGVATSLSQHLANRSMQNSLAVGGTTLAVFFPLGMAAGAGAAEAAVGGTMSAGALAATATTVALSVGTSGAFLAMSKIERDRILESAFVATGLSSDEKRVLDQKDVEKAEAQVAMNVLALPLSFLGVGALAGATTGAATKYLANAAMRGAMTEKGVSPELAGEMVRLANSGNTAVRGAARAKIDEFVGKVVAAEKGVFGGRVATREENDLIARAGLKGLIGSEKSPNVDAIESLGMYARMLKKEEYKSWLRKVAELVERSVPARTEEEGGIRFKAMMAAAHLGLNDTAAMVALFSSPQWQGEALRNAAAMMRRAVWSVQKIQEANPGITVEQARGLALKNAYVEIKYGRPLNRLSESEARVAALDAEEACRCAAYCPLPMAASVGAPAVYLACTEEGAVKGASFE